MPAILLRLAGYNCYPSGFSANSVECSRRFILDGHFMTESTDLTTEAVSGVQTILGRVGEFFHIFDLSFFVSGFVTVSALWVSYQDLGLERSFPYPSWVGAVAGLVACYVCGLMAFSGGRWLNGILFRRTKLTNTMAAALKSHSLWTERLQTYASDEEKGDWRLYIRLWQQLASTMSKSAVFSHLSRYWVMAATYDGLGAAFLVWSVVFLAKFLGIMPVGRLGSGGMATAFFGSVLLALLAFRQGGKYYEYQIEDAIAALAVVRNGSVL